MTTTASWYHAHQDSVKRSEGKSAVGLVAYITGQSLKDERTGTWCVRNHPGDVLAWGTIAPAWTPDHLIKPENLGKAWNEVEASETRKNSLVAVHWNVAGSREYSEDDHRKVAEQIAQNVMQRYGVMVTYGIHKPTDHGDDRNWHYHFGHNMRRVTSEGFGEKAREIIDKKTFVQETTAIRAMVAEVLNEHLARTGSNERVTHLSYEDRGVVQEPTKHLGNKQNQAELKGQSTETGDENRAIRERNAVHVNQQELRRRDKEHLDAEIYDIVSARLRQMREGTRKVEIPEQQWDMRDDRILADLGSMQERRQRVAAWDEWSEEEQKRLARTATSRNEEMETRANRGDIADANDRWAKAMHDSFNALGRPEANMVAAVGLEAERFREEQAQYRKLEAEATDPAKKKLLEFDRQISACNYMQVGAERCGLITSFIVGSRDNAISNRDREHAAEWREIGDKLSADRAELRETIDKGIHEQIDAFLKDASKGWQPMPKPDSQKETELKEQFFGWDPSRPKDERGPIMGRDLPPGEQPTPHENHPAWQTQTEPAWRNLKPGEKLEPNQTFTINEKSGVVQVPEKDKDRPQREGEAQEEVTEAKAAQLNKEDTTFDQELATRYRESMRDAGRSMGGRSR